MPVIPEQSGLTGAVSVIPASPPNAPGGVYVPTPHPPTPFPPRWPLPSVQTEPPKPGRVNQVSRRSLTASGPPGPPLVYGTQLVEGRVLQAADDAYGRWTDYVIGVCAGPVRSVNIYLPPGGVWQDGSLGWAAHLGANSQTPYPQLCYVEVRQYQAYYDGTNWVPFDPPMDPPDKWLFVVEGLKILDTRTSVTALSTNPAMILRDFLLNEAYGCNIPSADLDEQSFKDAADVCDQVVDSAARYTMNIAIGDSGTAEQWIETLCTHFAGSLYRENGLFRLWVDGIKSDSGVLFDGTNSRDHELSCTRYSQRPLRVQVKFSRSDNAWAEDTVSAQMSGAAAQGDLRLATYSLMGLTAAAQAGRVASYLLKVQSVAVLRVSFVASPVAAKLSRGDRFKLTANDITAQDFLLLDSQPLDSGEYAITAREYDADVYSDDAAIESPPVPDPLTDPNGTPPDVTALGWDDHIVRTVDDALGTVLDTKYARLTYSPPVYPYAVALVIRGHQQSLSMDDPLAWDDLGDEVSIPIAGNLPPAGGNMCLFWPVSYATEQWVYFTSGVRSGHTVNQHAAQVTVRVRSLNGNLSAGVTLYSPTSYASTTSGVDTGSANQNTQALRIVESDGGANYWEIKAAATLSADRTLVLPNTAITAGPIDVDGSGNVSFSGTAERTTLGVKLLETGGGSNFWKVKSAASLGSDRDLILPDASPPSSGFVMIDSTGAVSFRKEFSFSAHKNGTDQTGIADSTWTQLTFGSEDFDTGGCWNTSSSKFVASEAMRIRVYAQTAMTPAATETLLKIAIYKNGSLIRQNASQGSLSTRGLGVSISALLDLATNDEIEVYVYHTRGSDGDALGSADLTRVEGVRVG